MPISRIRAAFSGSAATIALAALLAGLWPVPAAAFEGDSAREAFRSGYAAYKKGDTATAIDALNYAAENGHAAALWQLGRMYATGDGVEKDEAKAFQIYSRIANEHADDNPAAPIPGLSPTPSSRLAVSTATDWAVWRSTRTVPGVFSATPPPISAMPKPSTALPACT